MFVLLDGAISSRWVIPTIFAVFGGLRVSARAICTFTLITAGISGATAAPMSDRDGFSAVLVTRFSWTDRNGALGEGL